MLAALPLLCALDLNKTKTLVELVDRHLRSRYRSFFDRSERIHPCLPVKSRKLINDNIWGVHPYYWPELALIDTPIMQRLRRIHQTSLAYYTYPSMRHSRFEHALGVVIASDLMYRHLRLSHDYDTLRFVNEVFTARRIDPPTRINPLDDPVRLELRLAALLHDTGHSLFSHTSEPHYGALQPVAEARHELEQLLGKRIGAGEVVSAAIAWSPAVHDYLAFVLKKLKDPGAQGRFQLVDQFEIGLMILGATSRPETQFLADIISSALDADKLDYLRRDGEAAGLQISFSYDRLL